jgi:RNase adaptor protein for sRNA GlmZ degradation
MSDDDMVKVELELERHYMEALAQFVSRVIDSPDTISQHSFNRAEFCIVRETLIQLKMNLGEIGFKHTYPVRK